MKRPVYFLSTVLSGRGRFLENTGGGCSVPSFVLLCVVGTGTVQEDLGSGSEGTRNLVDKSLLQLYLFYYYFFKYLKPKHITTSSPSTAVPFLERQKCVMGQIHQMWFVALGHH